MLNDEPLLLIFLLTLFLAGSASCYGGLYLLQRYRENRERSLLVLGAILTGIVPLLVLLCIAHVLKRYDEWLLGPVQSETVDISGDLSTMCYYTGGMLLLERSMLQKVQRRWLRYKHRHLLSPETRDVLKR